MMNSASQAWTMYPGLVHGAYEALHAHGTDEQKKTYLPKLVSGEWTGTMCLTEPHCGTDLGMLRSKALPQADGSWLITGNKIFISAGEHDMSENILHLVLARVPDAPEGTKRSPRRRVLLRRRAYAEGAVGLTSYVALEIDRGLLHPDEDVRKEAADEVALLTPIVKAFITDNAWIATSEAMQVFGGHGYISQLGME